MKFRWFYGAAVLGAVFFRVFLFEPFLVMDQEMAPALLKGDYLIVKKYSYGFLFLKNNSNPQKGDIVLLKGAGGRLMVKRIMGGPKDRIFYSKGRLFINEKLQPLYPPLQKNSFVSIKDQEVQWESSINARPYSLILEKEPLMSFGPYFVPLKHYFVMGDHWARSQDSRTWPAKPQSQGGEDQNFVPQRNIYGQAFRVLFSCEKFLFFSQVLCDFRTLRSGRWFWPVHQPMRKNNQAYEETK